MNKLKLITIIILIIALIGLILGINTIYKFCILQKIYRTISENIAKDNFYLEITTESSIYGLDSETSKTETFYRDGIGKLLAQNGIYTWSHDDTAYLVDDENKTIYLLGLDKNYELVSNEKFASLYPCYSYSFFQKLLYAGNLNNKIKNVMLDNQACIMISEKVSDGFYKTYWISKNSYLIKKAKIEFPTGETVESKYNLKFGETSIRDIELPDTTDYNFINNETGEVIIDNKKTEENTVDNQITNENTITNYVTNETTINNQVNNNTN